MDGWMAAEAPGGGGKAFFPGKWQVFSSRLEYDMESMAARPYYLLGLVMSCIAWYLLVIQKQAWHVCVCTDVWWSTSCA